MKIFKYLILGVIVSSLLLIWQACSSALGQKNDVDQKELNQYLLLEESLLKSNDQLNILGYRLHKEITRSVGYRTVSAPQTRAIDRAFQIVKKVSEYLQFTNDLKRLLINTTGGYIENSAPNGYAGHSEVLKTNEVLIGDKGSKSGKGYQLQKETENLVAGLNGIVKQNKPISNFFYSSENRKITIDQNSDPVLLMFEGQPMIVSMCMINQLESKALDIQYELLSKISNELMLSENELRPQPINIMATLDKTVYKPGETVKATIQMYSELENLRLKYDVQKAQKVTPIDQGKVLAEIPTTSDGFNSNGYKKETLEYSATISYAGKDSVFRGSIEYIVAKP